MKKFIAVLAMAFMVTACGEKVEVPPAHVGAILTKEGYKPDLVTPSKFRLEPCWAYCDKLVLVQLTDSSVKEAFELFMPQDRLNMSFDIRGTFRIKSDSDSIRQIFDKVPTHAQYTENGKTYCFVDDCTPTVSFWNVYKTYGRPVLREVIRTTLSEYTIDDIVRNREAVNAKVVQAIEKALAHTPVEMIRAGLAKVTPPDIIVTAEAKAKERQVEIAETEAEAAKEMVRLEKELEQARVQRTIDNEKANAVKEQNAIFSSSVTPEYLAYMDRQILLEMAKNQNAVFVPVQALDSLGLQQRVFGTVPSK